MELNTLPTYNRTDNPTHCCPKFDPRGWDQQDLHFKNKLFLKAKTHSLFHIPIDMGGVYTKTMKSIEEEKAEDEKSFVVLSKEKSPWIAEHYFLVNKEIPGKEMVRLNGDYITKVFEGPYKDMPAWENELELLVQSKGKKLKDTYFFYSTCPKCAKAYGKNYVVGFAEVQ
ncbi:MAG: hydrolase [Pseudobdellovibrio sp.]